MSLLALGACSGVRGDAYGVYIPGPNRDEPQPAFVFSPGQWGGSIDREAYIVRVQAGSLPQACAAALTQGIAVFDDGRVELTLVGPSVVLRYETVRDLRGADETLVAIRGALLPMCSNAIGLMAALGRALPQRLVPDARARKFVELRPGYQLRLERSGNLTESNGNARTLLRSKNELPGVGSSVYRLDREVYEGGASGQNLVFDPLLVWVEGQDGGPGGRSQFFGYLGDVTEVNREHWMVYYGGLSRGIGNIEPEVSEAVMSSNVLIGADDPFHLVQLRQRPDGEDLCDEPLAQVCLVPAGRTLLIPEIQVRIQGVTDFVSYGSTIRSALARVFDLDRFTEDEVERIARRVRLRRRYGPSLVAVRFYLEDPNLILSTPLEQGDELRW